MPLPETEIPGRLQAYFSERGIRITQQRRAVLRVIETATKHLGCQPDLAEGTESGCFRGPQHGISNTATAQAARADRRTRFNAYPRGWPLLRAEDEPRTHSHCLPALRKDHGVRNQYLRETEAASGKRLPFQDSGLSLRGRWLLFRLPAIRAERAKGRVANGPRNLLQQFLLLRGLASSVAGVRCKRRPHKAKRRLHRVGAKKPQNLELLRRSNVIGSQCYERRDGEAYK